MLGKTAQPRCPTQKSIANQRYWRPRAPHVGTPSLASGQAPDLPQGGRGAPYRRVLQTRFYLHTLKQGGQTHSSAWLLPTSTAKTSRRSTAFAPKHPGTLTLCRDGAGVTALSFFSTSSCSFASPAPRPCLSRPPWASGQALVFLLPFPALPSACVSGREEAALSLAKPRQDKLGPLSL